MISPYWVYANLFYLYILVKYEKLSQEPLLMKGAEGSEQSLRHAEISKYHQRKREKIIKLGLRGVLIRKL